MMVIATMTMMQVMRIMRIIKVIGKMRMMSIIRTRMMKTTMDDNVDSHEDENGHDGE